MILEKAPECFLGCNEIKPVNPKGNQSCIFIGRTDAEAPILWPPDVKNWLIGKNPDAGKDWKQRRRGWQRMRWLDGITDSVTWVWVNSGSWWWTGGFGVLQSMGLQRIGHDSATELNWELRKVQHTAYFNRNLAFTLYPYFLWNITQSTIKVRVSLNIVF